MPAARLLVAPGKVERLLGRDIGRKDKAVDQRPPLVTASIGAAPICNLEACGRAFLSFRPSDCTFQPYDGPRRLCRIDNTPNAKR
jgi:hypothetical protein